MDKEFCLEVATNAAKQMAQEHVPLWDVRVFFSYAMYITLYIFIPLRCQLLLDVECR